MQSNTLYRNLSLVIFTLVTLSFAGVGWGQKAAAPAAEIETALEQAAAKTAKANKEAEQERGLNERIRADESACKETLKEVKDNMKRCGAKCMQNVERCTGERTAQGSLTTGVLDVLLTAYAGESVGSSTNTTKCDLSAEEWNKNKDKWESEIRTAEDRIQKLNKEISENDDKLAKETLALEEKLARDEEAYKAKTLEFEAAELAGDEGLVKQKNDITKRVGDIMQAKRTEVNQIDLTYRSARGQLLNLKDSDIQRICLSKLRTTFRSNPKTYQGRGNAISMALFDNKERQAAFRTCREEKEIQKRNILADSEMKIGEHQAKLKQLETEMTSLETLGATLVDNMVKKAESLQNQKQTAAANYMKLQARNAQEKVNLMTAHKSAAANLAKELATEQKRLVQKQNQLNALGSKPPKTYANKKDTTFDDDFKAYQDGLDSLEEFQKTCCPVSQKQIDDAKEAEKKVLEARGSRNAASPFCKMTPSQLAEKKAAAEAIGITDQ